MACEDNPVGSCFPGDRVIKAALQGLGGLIALITAAHSTATQGPPTFPMPQPGLAPVPGVAVAAATIAGAVGHPRCDDDYYGIPLKKDANGNPILKYGTQQPDPLPPTPPENKSKRLALAGC
jgi:hypothetical protein